MTPHTDLIPVTLISAFTFGFVLRLLGSLKKPLAEKVGDENKAATVLSVFNLAMIPMMLISGILVDQLGAQGMLIVGSLVACLGLLALVWTRTVQGCLYAVFLLGLSEACLATGAVVLMPRALIEANESAALNLGFVFFGLGALLTPALSEVLLSTVGLRRTLCLAALGCLAPCVAAVMTASTSFHLESSWGGIWTVLGSPVFWLSALTFLFYCPLEGALGVWGAEYLQERGHSEQRARRLAVGFWLGLLASRLLFALAQQRELLSGNADPWVICFLALAAMVVLGNLQGIHYKAYSATGLFLVGVLLGPIVPTLLGYAFKQLPTNRGLVFGGTFALGAALSLVLAPLFGGYARRHQVRQSLFLPTMVALLLAGTALVLALLPALEGP